MVFHLLDESNFADSGMFQKSKTHGELVRASFRNLKFIRKSHKNWVKNANIEVFVLLKDFFSKRKVKSFLLCKPKLTAF